MDFDLSDGQAARLDRLRELVDRHGGAPVPADGLPGTHDDALAAAVRADDLLAGPDVPLLDRVLLVEEAARLGAPLHAAAELVVVPLLDAAVGPGAVAVVAAGSGGPSRYGAVAATVVEVAADGVRVGAVGAGDRRPVGSGFGSSYADVAVASAGTVAWRGAVPPRAAYRLALAAEIGGAADAALTHTAAYHRERRAFGRPLSTFQALRHRISELAVDVAGTKVLVHTGAWHGDAASIASAVAHATTTAARLPPDLHQLCGARGFADDFGLTRWTMLLQALRVELGGVTATALEHADARWVAEPAGRP